MKDRNDPEAPDSACETAAAATRHHLADAVAAIDEAFGEGFAAANPTLVASLVQASAIGRAVEVGREIHGDAMELIPRISRETNETILRLKPRLFG